MLNMKHYIAKVYYLI